MPTFDTQGSHTYTVPSGVETIRITASGAGGGGGSDATEQFERGGGDGGDGGYAQGTISVSAGESYDIYVPSAGSGGNSDGTGGAGGSNAQDSGGGGGSGGVAGDGQHGGGGGGGGANAIVYDSGGTLLAVGEGGGGGGGGGSDGEAGGGGGGGARGGAGGSALGGATVDGDSMLGDDATGSGSGGAGGDGGEAADGGTAGQNGSAGGAAVAGALTSTTTTTGGGDSGGAGGDGSGAVGTDGVSGSVVIEESPTPASLTVASIDATSATLDIGDPDNEDSAELQYKVTTDATYTTAATYGAGELPTTETINGLLNGTTYDFRIVVTNSVDSVTTVTTDTTVLPAPTNLTSPAVGDETIDVTWTANHSNGDTRVEYRADDSGSWTTANTVAFDTEADTITGLLNGQLYGVRVVASTDFADTVDQ